MYYQRDDAPTKAQILLKILGKGETVSGEVISSVLGVSRNAVWKQIQNLKALGYEIEAKRNLGYRLNTENIPDRLYPFRIYPALKTQRLGQAVLWKEEVTSTNDVAKRLAKDGEKEGVLVVAEKQTEGRGRRGRKWESKSYKGIYTSVILRPKRPLAEAVPYTFLGAYAVQRVCEDYGLDAFFKWPNDVYVKGRKISGVLAELAAIGQDIGHLVLGIGLNVNQKEFPNHPLATSLAIELDRDLSRIDVFAKLMLHLENGYEKLSEEVEWMIDVMRKNSLLLGKEVKVTGGIEIEGMAYDIADDGALIVKTDIGTKREKTIKVWAGDVSVREKE